MNHQDNIRVIFDALQVGLDGADFSGQEVDHSGAPLTINPDKFNRMLVVIDGETYCVAVFRPAFVPEPQPLSELFDEEERRR